MPLPNSSPVFSLGLLGPASRLTEPLELGRALIDRSKESKLFEYLIFNFFVLLFVISTREVHAGRERSRLKDCEHFVYALV